MGSLVQLQHGSDRRIARVDGDKLRLLDRYASVYALAMAAIKHGARIDEFAERNITSDTIAYDPIYSGEDSDWRLLPAFDHPSEQACCLVCGTGLTHRASAENRQAMHASMGPVSDSMRMYQWGIEGGRPPGGEIGTQPEWFYKGCGTVLRAHGEPLDVPCFGDDGGEESEIAGAYVIAPDGTPWRVGLMMANEFSDHKMEEKNYLYLAPSKLRTCSVGPELVTDPQFHDVHGSVRILRGNDVVWQQKVVTGEKNMNHTVANLEHHHFKYAAHRRPGDAHIYFFGADAFSFGEGVALNHGDVMEISMPEFGRPLCNPIRFDCSEPQFVRVRHL